MEIIVKTNDGMDLATLVQFLKTIEECCRQGASRELKLVIDGDGSARMSFDFEGVAGTDTIKPQDIDGELKFFIGE